MEFQGKQVFKGGENASSFIRSTNPPVSQRRSSTSRPKRYTRAPFTSTQADACWSPNTICRSICGTVMR